MNKGIKSKSGRLILISLIISMVAVFIGYGKEKKERGMRFRLQLMQVDR